ncbi:MAG: TetR/AcrR family transcriptional regulator [Devosia sp.]
MAPDPETHSGDLTLADGPAKSVARGRIAGQDPIKRQQIIDAARHCFMRDGFEATSMNEITAEAGVSKGTIYVYFSDKEDLFKELCRSERAKTMDFAKQELDAATTVREALTRFGIVLVTRMTSDHVIKAQRMVLAVADKFPKLAANFFGPEPFSGLVVIKTYLDGRVASGDLFIDDTDLAGRQFMDLAMSGFFKRRLFGNMQEEPAPEVIARTVERGVDMFLTYYGRKR